MQKLTFFLLVFGGCQDNYFIDKEPEQIEINKEQIIVQTKNLGECELTKIAKFSIEARILSKRNYVNSFDGELNPYDLAIGWKKMSSFEILNQCELPNP